MIGLALAALLVIPTPVEYGSEIILSHHRVVLGTDLPPCPTEPEPEVTGPCVWNVYADHVDGNGEGASLWVKPDGRIQYVWPHNPLHHEWRWVSGRIRKAHNAEWRRGHGQWIDPSCKRMLLTDDTSVVRCADGRRFVINY